MLIGIPFDAFIDCRVHTGEKPYQCPICGRQIARKDNVKVHIRSHLSRNPDLPLLPAVSSDDF